MAHEHILIVEDEKKIAELLRDYLVGAGFKVTCHGRGGQVVSYVKKTPPALILLDIMLPDVDGMDVCREIRKFSNIPVLMITARVDEVDRLIGLELGADDYICKPFSPREVVARVKAVSKEDWRHSGRFLMNLFSATWQSMNQHTGHPWVTRSLTLRRASSTC